MRDRSDGNVETVSPFWASRSRPGPDLEPLSADITVETCVIGGGYTGLSTAYHLADRGREVAVLDANDLNWGCSGRNAGSVLPTPHWGSFKFIGKTITQPEMARLIGYLRDFTTGFMPDLIRSREIDCNYRPSGVLLTDLSAAKHRRTLDELALWRSLGLKAESLSSAELRTYINTDAYHGGLLLPDVAYINPLAFGRGLATAAIRAGAALHPHTPAQSVRREGEDWLVQTPGGTVRARNLVIGTAGHTGSLWPSLQKAMLQVPLIMVASRPFADKGRSVLLKGVPFFENTLMVNLQVAFEADGTLTSGTLPPASRRATPAVAGRPISRRFAKRFPDAEKPVWRDLWSGKICARPDMLPRIFDLGDRAYAAFGYTGVGVGSATAYGAEIARLIGGASLEEISVPLQPLDAVTGSGAINFLQAHVVAPLCRALM